MKQIPWWSRSKLLAEHVSPSPTIVIQSTDWIAVMCATYTLPVSTVMYNSGSLLNMLKLRYFHLDALCGCYWSRALWCMDSHSMTYFHMGALCGCYWSRALWCMDSHSKTYFHMGALCGCYWSRALWCNVSRPWTQANALVRHTFIWMLCEAPIGPELCDAMSGVYTLTRRGRLCTHSVRRSSVSGVRKKKAFNTMATKLIWQQSVPTIIICM